jgi:sugar phosphate isomerase/epimerase
LDFGAAVGTAARLGFGHVDVVAQVDRPEAHRDALAQAGVLVSCGALGRALPDGISLDALSLQRRREAVHLVKRQINDLALLGATCAYLIPPADDQGACLQAYAEACSLLAEHAAERMVRLALEPIPGRLLGNAAGVLALLEDIDHPNLGLLLDVGHCLISGEEPAEVARLAGARLAYVHVDDNDGVQDLHWPLLTGRLQYHQLQQLFAVLTQIAYRGGLALELTPGVGDAEAALYGSKQLLARLG